MHGRGAGVRVRALGAKGSRWVRAKGLGTTCAEAQIMYQARISPMAPQCTAAAAATHRPRASVRMAGGRKGGGGGWQLLEFGGGRTDTRALALAQSATFRDTKEFNKGG